MASEATVREGALSRCFLELFAYVTMLKATCARRQPPVDEVRERVRELLHGSAQRMRALGVDPRDYDEARFAVCAWVDETVLNMPWAHREEWLKVLLQAEHYGTTKAGEEFFERLNLLRPEQAPVREVYSLCLALGFTGRYCAPGDELLLEQLRRSNLKLLGRPPLDAAALAREPLFLEWRIPGLAAPSSSGRPRGGLRLLLAVGAPAVAALLFLVYRSALSGVVASLLGRVTGS